MREAHGPAPIYLLAGGPGSRPGRDPVLTRVLESSGAARPTVAYIGAASGDSGPFFEMIAAHLERCGAGRIDLAATAGRRAKLEKTRAVLEKADMILVSGGDVEWGMAVLEERGLAPFLRDLFGAGKTFFGISAGSIMLARQWVRWRDQEDESTAELFPCLGLAEVNCDTHGEDEGWGELRALLALCPEGTSGFGIPTGAALRVAAGGVIEALGAPVERYARRRGVVAREGELRPAAL